MTEIGAYAFGGCKSLSSITIPNSVKEIGKGAFWDCTRLTSITIPNSVEIIGAFAFGGCYNLSEEIIKLLRKKYNYNVC